jgi:hypothetical protein
VAMREIITTSITVVKETVDIENGAIFPAWVDFVTVFDVGLIGIEG